MPTPKADKFARFTFQQLIDQITDNLSEMRDSKGRNRYGSGMTAQLVGEYNRSFYRRSGNKIVITVNLPEYWKFIEEGVKGTKNVRNNTGSSAYRYSDKQPPISAIRQFMRSRAVVPRSGFGKQNNKEQQLNSLAFVIARKIKEDGLEAFPFYSRAVTQERLDAFKRRYTDLYKEEFFRNVEFKILKSKNK